MVEVSTTCPQYVHSLETITVDPNAKLLQGLLRIPTSQAIALAVLFERPTIPRLVPAAWEMQRKVCIIADNEKHLLFSFIQVIISMHKIC